MEATKKKIGIFYRYNKYRPISGFNVLCIRILFYFNWNTIEKKIKDNLLFGKDLNETRSNFLLDFPKRKLLVTKEKKFKTRLD